MCVVLTFGASRPVGRDQAHLTSVITAGHGLSDVIVRTKSVARGAPLLRGLSEPPSRDAALASSQSHAAAIDRGASRSTGTLIATSALRGASFAFDASHLVPLALLQTRGLSVASERSEATLGGTGAILGLSRVNSRDLATLSTVVAAAGLSDAPSRTRAGTEALAFKLGVSNAQTFENWGPAMAVLKARGLSIVAGYSRASENVTASLRALSFTVTVDRCISPQLSIAADAIIKISAAAVCRITIE